jgi:hypothetical protein
VLPGEAICVSPEVQIDVSRKLEPAVSTDGSDTSIDTKPPITLTPKDYDHAEYAYELTDT